MSKNKRTVYLLTLIYLIPLILLILLNTFLSLFQTTYMETEQIIEVPLYKSDRWIIILIFFAAFLFLIYYFDKKNHFLSHDPKLLHLVSVGVGTLMCIAILIAYHPTACCDSKALAEHAVAFLHGDFSSLVGDTYLVHYPHQVGVIGLLEALFSLFGEWNYLAFQILNLIAIIFIMLCLYYMSALIFENNVVINLTSLISMGAMPLFMFVTFVYGDIPGLAFALGAITCFLKFLKRNQYLYLIPCSIFLGLSIILKSNNFIILTALSILLLLHALQQKKWQSFACMVGMIIVTLFLSSLPTKYYEKVSGVSPFPEGIPKIAWVAMGLQENDGVENGWYNAYNWKIYSENNFDQEKTQAACLDSIQDSIGYYLQHPKQGAYLAYTKIRSQWNDPGFQSQITNEWSSRHQENYSSFYHWLVFGQGKLVLEWVMNLYHFLVLAGTLLLLPSLVQKKKWNLSVVVLPLCIFGGYFFHLFWEAQARYALPYFVMMIPLAAGGISTLITQIGKRR